jgi:hypothetical protein
MDYSYSNIAKEIRDARHDSGQRFALPNKIAIYGTCAWCQSRASWVWIEVCTVAGDREDALVPPVAYQTHI